MKLRLVGWGVSLFMRCGFWGGVLLTSSTISDYGNFLGVETMGFAVGVEPLEGGVGLFDGDWIGCFRGWGVVDEEYTGAGLFNEV